MKEREEEACETELVQNPATLGDGVTISSLATLTIQNKFGSHCMSDFAFLSYSWRTI